MIRKLTAIVAMSTMAVALSGCEPESGGNPAPGGEPKRYVTPRVPLNPPQPNPDHGPGGPTPGPIAGDPNPHDRHTWSAFVSWSPAALFVEIDPPKGLTRQRSGGFWSDEGTASRGQRVTVTANWTDAAVSNRRTPPGRLRCVLVIDNVVAMEQNNAARSGGVICWAKL